MINMNIKFLNRTTVLIFGLMVLLICTGYQIIIRSNNNDTGRSIDFSSGSGLKIADVSSDIQQSTPNQSVLLNDDTQSTSKWNPMGDAVSRAEISEWFAKRGSFTFLDGYPYDNQGKPIPTAYDNYNIDTLKKLGDDGDLRALDKLVRSSKNADESKQLLEKAAIFGSTQALAELGVMANTIYLSPNKTIEEKKAIMIESLAYYEAAQIRGDWTANMDFGRILQKQQQIDLTEADKAEIQERAKVIYDDLQTKRTAMGLGDFDNSIPDSVMKYYEEMLRPLPERRE
jgi:hypothetical protein